jgi:nonsense-mediated mRNA decay protein 3
LEQLILKHNAHTQTVNIKERADGLDFYFNQKNAAHKMVEFFQAVAPVRFKTSERLISTDDQSNTANFKYTYSVEILPICRDDLICLPHKITMQLGNISPIVLCTKVTSVVTLIDPTSLQVTTLNTQQYWNNAFRSICNSKQLIEYTILDITPLGQQHGKYALSDVILVRSSDFGKNDTQFNCKTHLGHLFKPGDIGLGYLFIFRF